MTRPGALESKKRCHDLLHRDSDESDLFRKSAHFPDEPKMLRQFHLPFHKINIKLQQLIRYKIVSHPLRFLKSIALKAHSSILAHFSTYLSKSHHVYEGFI